MPERQHQGVIGGSEQTARIGIRAGGGKLVEGTNGFASLIFLERTSRGQINFVDANPYVLQTVFNGVDPQDRPDRI